MRLCMLLWIAAALIRAQNTPVQPIPFSHKTHSEQHLKCADCHSLPDPGEVMTFPSATKCMYCHRTIKTDSPGIKTLQAYAERKRPIPWVRVYEIPSYVYFSHKTHIDAGTDCAVCHGPVKERDTLSAEVPLHMQDCMNCHRAHKAPVDCGTCHELKN
ncbi:MAG TPA: cytochrome c3 family protein [Bryobacteraceae bacterium]